MPSLSTILIIGTGMITAATAALFLLVRRDLGPASGLRSPQRLLLAAALGSGVIAFAIKLAIVATLSAEGVLQRTTLNTALPKEPPPTSIPEGPLTGQVIWQALPWVAPEPDDNPTTPAKVELGRRLFNDERLSRDGTVSCATCHDVERGAGADGRRVSLGINSQLGLRNAPTVYNAAFQALLFWDGRARSLEEQALESWLHNFGQ